MGFFVLVEYVDINLVWVSHTEKKIEFEFLK